MSLIQLTLSGGALILLIVLARALALHHLPKETFPVLWVMAALRLLVPFFLPVPLPMVGPVRRLQAAGVYRVADVSMPGAAAAPVGTAISNFRMLLAVFYRTGAVLLAAYFAVLYVRARLRFRTCIPCDAPVVRKWLSEQTLRRPLSVQESDQITSPLTCGVLRPVILLPRSTACGDQATLTYILTHELVHIRRFDGVIKLLFAAALCVHWFNPLVWAMYVLANRDLELSCDARVLCILGSAKKAPYALTLIRMEETRGQGLALYSHFSKLAIEERIEAIMKYKKPSVLAAALAVVLVLGATTAFASPVADGAEIYSITGKGGEKRKISTSQTASAERIAREADFDDLQPVPVPENLAAGLRELHPDMDISRIQCFSLPDNSCVLIDFGKNGD